MKKFKVTIPCEYIQGHLRYGHAEGIIEAKNIESITNLGDLDLDIVVDDYEIDDYELDFENARIEEIETND